MKSDDLPDEEKPVGRPKTYILSKRVQQSYDTHAMRAHDAIEKVSVFEAYDLSRWDQLKQIVAVLTRKAPLERGEGQNGDS